MDYSEKYSRLIKDEALRIGFSDCGISKAEPIAEESIHLSNWLNKGYQAEMNYLERNRDKRYDPILLVENAKSVITVLLNYYPSRKQNPEAPIISKYAYGDDYHDLIQEKLNCLFEYINTKICRINSRSFVDSAPILEKAWAAKAGLGWIGKNSLLLSKKYGSFVFIGELIIDLELEYDKPINNGCGSCTKCIDACPTNAIVSPYIINANKCIAYLTIEKKGELPLEFKGKFNNCVYGCDICQDVCPYNKNNTPNEIDFSLKNNEWLDLNTADFNKIKKEHFDQIFKNTTLKRSKYERFRRNLDFIV